MSKIHPSVEKRLKSFSDKTLLEELLSMYDSKKSCYMTLLTKGSEAEPKSKFIIDELVEREVYPTPTPYMIKHNINHYHMVDTYGVNWNKYDGLPNCPHCGKSWEDEKLGPPFKLERLQTDLYRDKWTRMECPHCNNGFERTSAEEYAKTVKNEEIKPMIENNVEASSFTSVCYGDDLCS